MYKKAFGVEVSGLMRFGDMPSNPEFPMPEEIKERVLQATLEFGGNSIRLSDSFSPVNDISTDLISITLEADVDHVKKAYELLNAEGNVILPLQQTFFSPCY